VPPIQSALFKNNKLYFYIIQGIYKPIQNFNTIEFSLDDNQWIKGISKFDKDLSIKGIMFEKYLVIKNIDS